ncbi:MAG: hypothetical protein ACRDTA_30180, partial [Pseudonocardiaceae bacterium]
NRLLSGNRATPPRTCGCQRTGPAAATTAATAGSTTGPLPAATSCGQHGILGAGITGLAALTGVTLSRLRRAS